MTIQSTATFDMTVDQLVALAYQMIGFTGPDGDVEPGDLVLGRKILFLVLQSFQNTGVILRAKERVTVTIVDGQAYVDMPSDTLSVEENAMLDYADGVQRPMTMYSEEDYQRLPNKQTTGAPNIYAPEKLNATETWRVWLFPVPDDSGTYPSIVIPRTRRLRDVNDGAATIDLHPKWYLAVVKALSAELARVKGRRDLATEQKMEAREERELVESDETERGPGRMVLAPGPWEWQ